MIVANCAYQVCIFSAQPFSPCTAFPGCCSCLGSCHRGAQHHWRMTWEKQRKWGCFRRSPLSDHPPLNTPPARRGWTCTGPANQRASLRASPMWTGRQTRTHTAMCVLSGTHSLHSPRHRKVSLSLSLSHTHTHTHTHTEFAFTKTHTHIFYTQLQKGLGLSLAHTHTHTHTHAHTHTHTHTHKQALKHPNRIMVLPHINLLKPFTAYPVGCRP